MHIVTVTTKGRSRPNRFKGICAVARELGITRQHLYLVLLGERHSPRITDAIQMSDARDLKATVKPALHGANSNPAKTKSARRIS